MGAVLDSRLLIDLGVRSRTFECSEYSCAAEGLEGDPSACD